MRSSSEKRNGIAERWRKIPKEKKLRFLGGAALVAAATVIALIPYFVTLAQNRAKQADDRIAKEMQALFDRGKPRSPEEADALLRENGYAPETLLPDGDAAYVWFPESGSVVIRTTESMALSEADCAFSLLDETACIAVELDGALGYLLGVPNAVRRDLSAIYAQRADPTRAPLLGAEGIYRTYTEFVSASTLFVVQAGRYGLAYYASGAPAVLSERTALTAVFCDVDMRKIDSNLLDVACGELLHRLRGAETIILTEQTRSLEPYAVQDIRTLREFRLDGADAFFLSGEALVEAETGRCIAYPAGTEHTEIVLGDEIRSVAEGALCGVQATSLTMPFVGQSRGSSAGAMGLFGYLFGRAERGTAQPVGNGVLYFAIPSSLRRVVLTDESSIARYAFAGCEFLCEIVLNEGIRSIGNYAFDRCNALRELEIPNSVSEMELSADNALSALERLTCPSGLNLEFLRDFARTTEGNRSVYTKKSNA